MRMITVIIWKVKIADVREERTRVLPHVRQSKGPMAKSTMLGT